MSLHLQRLSVVDGPEIYALVQSILTEDGGPACGISPEEFQPWLQRQHEISLGINIPEGRVPQTTYWLYNDNTPVGMCKLRTVLSPALAKRGGHIGYAIAPFARGRGYGKEQLRLILIEAKRQGMTRAMVTVRNHITASIRVALFNGGIIERVSEEDHYIWFDLK